MENKITFIMPAYNSAHYVRTAIDSLFNQTNANWKLICVDDGSTDCTREIVEEYVARDKRVKLICQNNTGPAVARARAIAVADTDYVGILDADDSLPPLLRTSIGVYTKIPALYSYS